MDRDSRESYWLEQRCKDIEDRLKGAHEDLLGRLASMGAVIMEMQKEIDQLKRAQVGLDTAISLARWVGPIVVALAGILIGKFG